MTEIVLLFALLLPASPQEGSASHQQEAQPQAQTQAQTQPGPSPPTAEVAPAAREAKPNPAAARRGGCDFPVYLRLGKPRCADKPVATAFGRVTWVEKGRPVTVDARQVDLPRTLAAQKAVKRRAARGGFSMTGSGEAPPSLAQTRPLVDPEAKQGEPSERVILHTGNPEPKPLTLEERESLQEQLAEARSQLDILEDQYRAIALTGGAPTNTLGRAIEQRERQIRRLEERLRR